MSVHGTKIKRVWRRITVAAGWRVRQRVTLAGFLYTVVMTLVGLAAFVSANNLLFLLFAALLATMLVSGFISRLGLAGLELNLELPEHVAARRRVAARLVIANSKWMPSFSIHLRATGSAEMNSLLYFPVLPAVTRTEEGIQVWFKRRGIHRENDFEFSTRFPFGFAERRTAVRLEREILVYPAIEPRPAFEKLLTDLIGDLESWQRGRGHDFYRIRPYEASESARHVDWKATAHTGNLQVREFAREEDRRVMICLDIDMPPAAAEEFEAAIDCCAYLIWRLVGAGAPVRLLTQNYDRRVPDETDAYGMLRYLALVEPASGAVPMPPDAERETCVALTMHPARFVEAGWMDDNIVDVRVFGTPAGAAGAGDGSHQHHDR